MTPDDPRHGQPRGATAHERSGVPMCEPCRQAKRAYSRRLEKERALLGRSRMIDTTLLRRHVDRLTREGMSIADIARAAGVARDTVRRISNGEVKVVLERSARRIAAVQPQASTHFRPALGYRRRLQALIALGHPAKYLSERTGMSESRLSMFLDGSLGRDSVRIGTAEAIDALWAELAMTPGHSARSINRARREGWLPPLAWDDIDDPNERPALGSNHRRKTDFDEAIVLRVLAGERLPMTRAERLDVVRRLRDVRGWSEERIEQHTGIVKASCPRRYPRAEEAAA